MNEDKVVDFDVLKDRSEGKVTPKVLRDTMDSWVEDYGKLDSMIIVYVDEEGYISINHTTMKYTELIGLLDVAKANALDQMRE